MMLPNRSTLTEKEGRVMRLASEGLSNKEIAAHLSISEHTVKSHIRRCLHVLGARNRTHAAVLFALQPQEEA